MLLEHMLDVGGRRTRLLRGGRSGAPAAIFLHGAIPGVTPFCGGAHLWGEVLDAFCADREVIALDSPGSGGTDLGSEPLTLDLIGQHVRDTLAALSIASVDVVGHDLGGLVGLWLAMEDPDKLRGLSVVASAISTPRGDGLDDLLFVGPPQPLWGRESQDWALDRVSYSHAHIDPAFLDALVTAGEGAPHRAAVEMMKAHYGRTFMPSVNRAKYRLWETCRNNGLRVPVQLVWASHDPAAPRDAGFALFDAIAPRQPAAQFHLINRAGSFPFREQPAAFHHIVAAFQEGVWSEPRAAAA